MILISGAPGGGKTTLACRLAPYMERVHIDAVCLVLAVKRPDFLPPVIDPEGMMGVNLGEFQTKINAFVEKLDREGRVGWLIGEVLDVMACRERVTVVEGYALNFSTAAWVLRMKAEGLEPTLVDLSGDVTVVGGETVGRDDAVRRLRRQLDACPLKHL